VEQLWRKRWTLTKHSQEIFCAVGAKSSNSRSMRTSESEPITLRGLRARCISLGLLDDASHRSVAALNRMLAHTLHLHDLRKKAYWQTSGANFYEPHLLFDKHHGERQSASVATVDEVSSYDAVVFGATHQGGQRLHQRWNPARWARDHDHDFPDDTAASGMLIAGLPYSETKLTGAERGKMRPPVHGFRHCLKGTASRGLSARPPPSRKNRR
jgi:hypothetical protein